MTERENLELQKKECEDAVLTLMKDEGNDHMFVRGVLEALIFKIEGRLKNL